MNILSFPDEISLQVFSTLSEEDVMIVSCTCKQWNRITKDQSLKRMDLQSIFKIACFLGLNAIAEAVWTGAKSLEIACKKQQISNETLEEFPDAFQLFYKRIKTI